MEWLIFALMETMKVTLDEITIVLKFSDIVNDIHKTEFKDKLTKSNNNLDLSVYSSCLEKIYYMKSVHLYILHFREVVS